MKINWKVRFKNIPFYVSILLALLGPILITMDMTYSDITSWAILGDVLMKAVTNPFVLFTVAGSVYGAIVDPTTKGFGDSTQALTYIKPKGKKVRK